jgi:hypothetical protein
VLAEIARRIAVIDRFQDFTRGVVGLRDLSSSYLHRLLAVSQRRHRRAAEGGRRDVCRTLSIIGVIAVAAIVIGINMFADARLANLRVDLTRSHIYTLSTGTRQICPA